MGARWCFTSAFVTPPWVAPMSLPASAVGRRINVIAFPPVRPESVMRSVRLLSSVGPLEEINELMDKLAEGKAIRQVVVPVW